MSVPAHLEAREVTAVLHALWKRFDTEVPVGELLRETLAPLPHVQQALVQLAARGCRIERIADCVRLASVDISCWPELLAVGGRRVQVYTRTTSTNDRAWQWAPAPDSHGAAVLADEQTAGRGRLGHAWSAKAAQSVLMSLIVHESQLPASAQSPDRLTLLAGYATALALEKAGNRAGAQPLRVSIKWPNDLLIDGRKVAGILVERRQAGGIYSAVIGVGVNVCQIADDFPPDLHGRAISLFQATGRMIERLLIIETLLEHFDAALAMPAEDAFWLAEWKSRCAILGRQVRVREGDRVWGGEVVDIAPLEGLVLRDQAGTMRFVSAQTASLE